MSCIYCGDDTDTLPSCPCWDSRVVVEIWVDDERRVYEVRYPHRQDPVQVGAQGNRSRRDDHLVAVRWANDNSARDPDQWPSYPFGANGPDGSLLTGPSKHLHQVLADARAEAAVTGQAHYVWVGRDGTEGAGPVEDTVEVRPDGTVVTPRCWIEHLLGEILGHEPSAYEEGDDGWLVARSIDLPVWWRDDVHDLGWSVSLTDEGDTRIAPVP